MLPGVNALSYVLPPDLYAEVQFCLEQWDREKKSERLWARDASLWTGADEDRWLGWLDIVPAMLGECPALTAFAEEIRREGFTHALLLGMGGSSLCPEVLALSIGSKEGFPALHVLDSTDPAQVAAIERRVELSRTLVLVASKSGTTLEPNIFKQYFYERMRSVVGPASAGKHFVAITDPGSKMQQVAEADGFRRIFFGVPSIGGRYSALSNFGMVPAAVMGMDVAGFLANAQEMVRACGPEIPARENPGVILGALLGTGAKRGRDKLTLITSPQILDLGAWLEQLVAESTGKDGKAIIPVDREPPGKPESYGTDRIFVYLRLASQPDAAQDHLVAQLAQAGHALVRIELKNPFTLGQEFFRWEVATAVAGSILGIHPFNQPDVEASKVETRKLTAACEAEGALPPEEPFLEADGIKLFADADNLQALRTAAGDDQTLRGYLRAHLQRAKRENRDYFAVLAYIEMKPEHEKPLQEIRAAVRDARGVATCLGFGPRFLHSTGQAYKGGPNSGVFLQITCDDAADLNVPGQKYTFGMVKAAQARGDFAVLAARQRRALRVHLGADVPAGLRKLVATAREALV